MARARSIFIVLASAVLGAFGGVSSSSASTLLSGYGGPGAGEQAIIGSTLLKVPPNESGGRSARGRSAGAGSGVPLLGEGPSASGSKPSSYASGSTASLSNGGGGSPTGGSSSGQSVSEGRATPAEAGAPASAGSFAYPIALRSTSTGSPALSLSSGDLAEIGGLIVGLLALGTLTVRLARLRR